MSNAFTALIDHVRRRLLLAAASGTGAGLLSADPFSLGIASGDPLPNGVVLWTRLAPDRLGRRHAAPAGFGALAGRGRRSDAKSDDIPRTITRDFSRKSTNEALPGLDPCYACVKRCA
jgi:alkaline phosphatase D